MERERELRNSKPRFDIYIFNGKKKKKSNDKKSKIECREREGDRGRRKMRERYCLWRPGVMRQTKTQNAVISLTPKV
jgi:hypothetical protein